MAKIKIAVIGAGTIAQIGHLPYYRDETGVELCAVVDVNLERATDVARKFGANAAYSDAKEMFEKENVDAVSICTTNQSHVSLSKLAFSYGVDVLVEKPLAVSSAEAWELVNEAERAKCICMVGMSHRFRNESQALKRFIEAGDLGDIYYANAKILRRRGTPTGWFTDKSKSGGGPLMDIGVHVLDLAWWLVGKPVPARVSGQLVKKIGRYETIMSSRWQSADSANRDNSIFDVEDFASAYIRFENNMVMNLEVSWALNGPQDDALKVNIYGDKGGVSLDPLRFYSEHNHILSESALSVQSNDQMKDEISHFIECVQRRETPLPSVHEGAQIVDILEAIHASSELNREVIIQK
ncbi:Gfo/Idh/MocA family protein [Alicyclobacillus sp. SO9]|uniref:Gfo/Idh/MocA family protein n=1 Tax=Alicyclobacillus sp. SO9 TaxID=2665646 RepID=UPI0018E7318B|nr:Gfo/Idh/MocA family oxidoreductase [Alicyclobacillus sp. SO9]QQE80553.1 Gfo/Idh/MocA family oxidoreductase [Alicyclobacillus sp. SO9]